MSRHGDVTLEWGDAERRFRLGYGELRQLQEKRDAGPAEIQRRLLTDTFRLEDIAETILFGLVGAGTSRTDALALIGRYVYERPLFESKWAAVMVLDAVLRGPEDEQIKKARRETSEASVSQTEKSPSLTSTEPAQPSDTIPDRSTPAHPGNSPPL